MYVSEKSGGAKKRLSTNIARISGYVYRHYNSYPDAYLAHSIKLLN